MDEIIWSDNKVLFGKSWLKM